LADVSNAACIAVVTQDTVIDWDTGAKTCFRHAGIDVASLVAQGADDDGFRSDLAGRLVTGFIAVALTGA